MKQDELKKAILKTYTPERYITLFLYMYSMVGEGFIAAESIYYDDYMDKDAFDEDNIDDDFWGMLDSESDKLLKELQGELKEC